MSIIKDVTEGVITAKKKYDKNKYIDVLEEAINKYEEEIKRLSGQLNNLINKDLTITSDHLELFEIYRTKGLFTLEYLTDYSKETIDLEIALSELLDKKYFVKPRVVAMGTHMKLDIPNDKKIELLIALKNNEK